MRGEHFGHGDETAEGFVRFGLRDEEHFERLPIVAESVFSVDESCGNGGQEAIVFFAYFEEASGVAVRIDADDAGFWDLAVEYEVLVAPGDGEFDGAGGIVSDGIFEFVEESGRLPLDGHQAVALL